MTTKAAAHRKKWGWAAYQPGETVMDAGIRVLSEPIELGPEMRNTHYDVLYLCCDKPCRLSHETIRERSRKGSTRCRACGYKRTAEVRRLEREEGGVPKNQRRPPPDYGVHQMTAPVPTYVQLGRTIDCDVGAQPDAGVDWMSCFSPAVAEVLREVYDTTHRVRPNAQQEEL